LPFTLGGLRVSPATLELACDGSVETIEARMMQVLTALHRRRGEVVSREDLSLLCWDGRIVGTDALNRVISRLRKSLSASPAVVIDTIPKVGYRLRVQEVDEVKTAASGAEQRRSRISLVAGGGALLLVILVATLLFTGGRNARWTVDTMRPLTRDPGIEIFPALSPDGRQLAYASGLGSFESTDIYLRGTALGETRPVRLTDTILSEVSPAWSPDGARLAFVRIGDSGRPCEIVIITLPDRAERSAGRCKQARLTKIDWLGARTILYSDGPSAGPSRLFALDVDSGTSRPLTVPSARMLGDSAPTVSADSRHIAFRRTVTHGNDDIFLLNRASGAVRPLGVGGWKAIGMAWAPDSRTLFMTSNRGGDFGLWSIDIDSKDPPQRSAKA
jgi:Tol biopolymer transport system component/DNA-binding winged helix-turn-helix (wHTH) protein